MHVYGLLIDQDLWRANIEEARQKQRACVATLDELFLPLVGPKTPPQIDEAAVH